MTRRSAVLLVVALLVPAALAIGATVASGRAELLGASLPMMLAGVVLIVRVPTNRIGWVLASVGSLYATGSAAELVASAAGAAGALSTAALFLAWYSEWFWVPVLYLWLVILPLLLPSGEASTNGSLRVGAIVAVVATGSAMFQRDLLTEKLVTPLHNPVGLLPYGDVDYSAALPLLLASLAAMSAWAALSLLSTYRSARGVERQQLKVIFVGVAVTVAGFVLGNTLDWAGLRQPFWVEHAIIAVTPIAILVAVSRYRLYEIDRLLARTVTYGVISAVLVGVYAAIVAVSSMMFGFESDLLVAVATLAAGAVFAPVRRRVQANVDRRFNRARYDAAQTVEQFAVRLRDNVDLNRLTADLRAVVSTTMQPTTTSVWMSNKDTTADRRRDGSRDASRPLF